MKHMFDFTAANKYRSLDPDLHRARFDLIDFAIARQKPFSVEQAKEIVAKTSHDKASTLLDELIQRNLIGLDTSEEIAYLYPVSCVETAYRVRLADTREFWAMCAIDSLGCAATFGMPVEISALTKDTNEAVYAKSRLTALARLVLAGCWQVIMTAGLRAASTAERLWTFSVRKSRLKPHWHHLPKMSICICGILMMPTMPRF